MAPKDPNQQHLFADDPSYYSPERLKDYGERREFTESELLHGDRTDGPRLMPGRVWSREVTQTEIDNLKTIEKLYIDLRLKKEALLRAQQEKDPKISHGDFWPNSSIDGHLRIDTTGKKELDRCRSEGQSIEDLRQNKKIGKISLQTYGGWLVDSIRFYEELGRHEQAKDAATHSPETHGAAYREQAWQVAEARKKAGLDVDGRDPKRANETFDQHTIGRFALEVGFYGKRLRDEQRGFDPRGFRLDAHHIPYTVTVDITQQIEEKTKKKINDGMSESDAKREARKEARHEARAAGPAIMIPWDLHKRLHEERNSHVFTEARNGKPLTIFETPELQLQNDMEWLKDKMRWIGYKAEYPQKEGEIPKDDFEHARKEMLKPIQEYSQRYTIPAQAPAVNSVSALSDIKKLRGFDGQEVG